MISKSPKWNFWVPVKNWQGLEKQRKPASTSSKVEDEGPRKLQFDNCSGQNPEADY